MTLGTAALILLSIASVAAPSNAATRYPLSLNDASGARVVIASRPQRIVSLAPSVTEILFGIGLDPEVVGISDADKKRFFQTNAEAVFKIRAA